MRHNKLQQGCLLSDGDVHKLGLVQLKDSQKCAIVISHDCDLTSEADEHIEVIVGSIISKPNSSYAKGRHPRCLHLSFSEPNSESIYVELKHSNKHQVSKSRVEELAILESQSLAAEEEKRVLKQWLAARYGRPAFPNAFEERLRKKIKNVDVLKKIETILRPCSDHVVALFFDLGKERSEELDNGQPYFLSISVVYDAERGAQIARQIAEETASKLTNLFNEVYGSADSATEIVLERCNAVADSHFSLADLRKVDQWRLEHLSFQDSPISPLLTSGQTTF